MTAWSGNDIERIGSSEELQLASLKKDGTLGKPVTIWVVRVGDHLYVRAYRGRGGTWFRDAQLRLEGHISAGGVSRDAKFVDVTQNDKALSNAIDAAYQSKYRRYSSTYVKPMVDQKARAATLELIPSK